ncbi:hypothetical protein Y032_0011g1284 [Ancylostoma ceylanicum]|uniref:Uncharacterized protein n=1 Tax=Ancylostoma ceylanicum TaxID=53326 RepID=A0A016VD82_9BILA|nr:hypothetical protein Y032_0011g1284 [Ancylostoma ceylanicum]
MTSRRRSPAGWRATASSPPSNPEVWCAVVNTSVSKGPTRYGKQPFKRAFIVILMNKYSIYGYCGQCECPSEQMMSSVGHPYASHRPMLRRYRSQRSEPWQATAAGSQLSGSTAVFVHLLSHSYDSRKIITVHWLFS